MPLHSATICFKLKHLLIKIEITTPTHSTSHPLTLLIEQICIKLHTITKQSMTLIQSNISQIIVRYIYRIVAKVIWLISSDVIYQIHLTIFHLHCGIYLRLEIAFIVHCSLELHTTSIGHLRREHHWCLSYLTRILACPLGSICRSCIVDS